MEKLRLDLQNLTVQSFVTHDSDDSRTGTVHAHLQQEHDITGGGNTCEGGVTCAGGGGCYYESWPNDTCYASCDQLWGCGGGSGGGDDGGGGGSGPFWGDTQIASHC